MVCPDTLNSFSLLLFRTIKCYIFLSFFCAWIWAPASSHHRYRHIPIQLPQPQAPPCCTIHLLTHPYAKVLAFYPPAKQTLSCLIPASITEPVLNLFAELWPCTYFVPHPRGSKSSCQIIRQKATDKRFSMVHPESLWPPRSHSVDFRSLSGITWSSPPFAGREAGFYSRENWVLKPSWWATGLRPVVQLAVEI